MTNFPTKHPNTLYLPYIITIFFTTITNLLPLSLILGSHTITNLSEDSIEELEGYAPLSENEDNLIFLSFITS
jgi:hypothetical protein